jgi:hypothetical protein
MRRAVARARDAGGQDHRSARSGLWANTLDLIEAHENVYGVVGLLRTKPPRSRLCPAPRPPESSGSARSASTTTRLRAAHAGEAVHLPTGLAKEAQLPVVIHNRAADEDTVSILRQWFDGTVVLHCFSSVALLDEAIEQGWYVSFAGNVTYKNADDLRVAARAVPAERLLAETDCPYLAPQPVRGKTNEPAYVVHTVAALAEARGEDSDALGAQIDANATEAFGLP